MRLSGIIILVFLLTANSKIIYAIDNCASSCDSSIHGLRSVSCKDELHCDNNNADAPLFLSGDEFKLRLFGNALNKEIDIGITEKPDSCKYTYKIETMSKDEEHSITITLRINVDIHTPVRHYLCIKEMNKDWIHQGTEEWKTFYVHDPVLIMPLWSQIIITILSICMSSLMSGLNLGLMALDMSELTVISRSGQGKEKQYAKQILPVRKKGNILLCSILFSCTIFNAILTVVIDNWTGDVISIIIVTFTIVIFCEIVPQAVCSRVPLWIGAKTIYITKATMVITAPFSYPFGKLLDKILGEENIRYPKERLKELVKIADVPISEAAIISGALDLSKTKVGEIMTMIDDVFKLPITGILDYKTVGNIMFSDGKHMAFIMAKNEQDKDVVLGLVTLEDILEELLQEEIFDETDIIADNRSKKKIANTVRKHNITMMIRKYGSHNISITPQMKSAACNYLSSCVEPFKNDKITETVLWKLLHLNLVEMLNPSDSSYADMNLYTKGKKVDFFIMILEGKVLVSVGKENLIFEGGPFFCFGHLALTIPDNRMRL